MDSDFKIILDQEEPLSFEESNGRFLDALGFDDGSLFPDVEASADDVDDLEESEGVVLSSQPEELDEPAIAALTEPLRHLSVAETVAEELPESPGETECAAEVLELEPPVADLPDTTDTTDTTEEPVAEEPETVPVAASETVFELECPECRGALTLERRHLGVEGVCVWCHASIVAAESGRDGVVRVFPVFGGSVAKPVEPAAAPEPAPVESVETSEVEAEIQSVQTEIEAPQIDAEVAEPVLADEPPSQEPAMVWGGLWSGELSTAVAEAPAESAVAEIPQPEPTVSEEESPAAEESAPSFDGGVWQSPFAEIEPSPTESLLTEPSLAEPEIPAFEFAPPVEEAAADVSYAPMSSGFGEFLQSPKLDAEPEPALAAPTAEVAEDSAPVALSFGAPMDLGSTAPSGQNPFPSWEAAFGSAFAPAAEAAPQVAAKADDFEAKLPVGFDSSFQTGSAPGSDDAEADGIGFQPAPSSPFQFDAAQGEPSQPDGVELFEELPQMPAPSPPVGFSLDAEGSSALSWRSPASSPMEPDSGTRMLLDDQEKKNGLFPAFSSPSPFPSSLGVSFSSGGSALPAPSASPQDRFGADEPSDEAEASRPAVEAPPAVASRPNVVSRPLSKVGKPKVRKGFLVLMVVILGFACGAALASYVLPVDLYVQ
ncbi:MAG TPA: hypothetical protein PLA50_15685, partial [Bacteroidia bacterium]|nr:hypothetical protein [Bacteroidia bacterium]